MSINYRQEIEGLKPYKPGKPIEDVKKGNMTDKGINKSLLTRNENPPIGYYQKKRKEVLN